MQPIAESRSTTTLITRTRNTACKARAARLTLFAKLFLFILPPIFVTLSVVRSGVAQWQRIGDMNGTDDGLEIKIRTDGGNQCFFLLETDGYDSISNLRPWRACVLLCMVKIDTQRDCETLREYEHENENEMRCSSISSKITYM